MSLGTTTLRPRVRGLEERFASRVLPLFARLSEGNRVRCLRSCICTGLAQVDLEPALGGLLEAGLPLSRASIRLDGGEAWSKQCPRRHLREGWRRASEGRVLVEVGALREKEGGPSRQIWPEAREQWCWNKTRNMIDRLPQREEAQARLPLRKARRPTGGT